MKVNIQSPVPTSSLYYEKMEEDLYITFTYIVQPVQWVTMAGSWELSLSLQLRPM